MTEKQYNELLNKMITDGYNCIDFFCTKCPLDGAYNTIFKVGHGRCVVCNDPDKILGVESERVRYYIEKSLNLKFTKSSKFW